MIDIYIARMKIRFQQILSNLSYTSKTTTKYINEKDNDKNNQIEDTPG